MKLFLSILLSLFWVSVSRAQLELPVAHFNDSIFYNNDGRYTFKYLPHYKLSHWIAYKLTASDLVSNTERSDRFATDKAVAARGFAVASPNDYAKSGYDRGHLLPSADRVSSAQANRSTFLMSNMAPQLPAVNRGTWKTLEEQVRRWAVSFDTLYIVCGSIVKSGHGTIGNSVAIPQYFFKAILLRKGDKLRSNCYIMPNVETISKSISDYLVTIDSLEKAAGIDLIWNNGK